MPTFIDYKKEIVDFFKERKQRDDLDHFETISPGRLRDLLLKNLCPADYKNEFTTLKRIFDEDGKFNDLELAIKREGIDKLRPVQYFIQGKTSDPSDDTVILLSILIDFQPRPYTAWKEKNIEVDHHVEPDYKETQEPLHISSNDDEDKIDQNSPTNVDGGEVETPTKQNSNTPLPERNNWNLKDKKSLSIMAGALVITLLMAFYSWPHKQCMYWDGEKYIAIHCDEADFQRQSLALNNEKLKNFKRITRKDTLTEKHVNKVWYSKIATEVEFFTCPGLHPVHPDRSLKAATLHIIEKYAMGKVNNEKGAVD